MARFFEFTVNRIDAALGNKIVLNLNKIEYIQEHTVERNNGTFEKLTIIQMNNKSIYVKEDYDYIKMLLMTDELSETGDIF